MSDARERLSELLDQRRAGAADDAGLAELDALLTDPALARLALATEEVQRLVEHALRGDAARARFAAGVVATVRSLPRRADCARWRRAAACAAVAAAAILLAALGRWAWGARADADDPATIAAVTGADARIVRAHAAARDGAARPGDEIVAGAAGATLRWSDGTRIELSGRGRLALERGGGKRLALGRGRIAANVAPQPALRPLRIATPHASAVVVGTRFTLDIDATRTRLVVAAGTVRFAGDGQPAIDAGAGVAAEARSGGPVAARRIEPVFAEDFEGDELPRGWTTGALALPPVANGSCGCAIGGIQPYAPTMNTVRLERDGYARYGDDLRLGFDVLVDAPVHHLGIMAWDADRRQNYGIELPPPEPGGWVHVELRFADLRGLAREGDAAAAGDRLDTLYLMAGEAGTTRLYIDNVAIWRER